MNKYITKNTLCAGVNCPAATNCMRHTKYLEAQESEMLMQVLNQSHLNITSDGCQYLHIPQDVTVAHGFRKMYGSMPRHSSLNLWKSFPNCDSRRQFYRLLSGEVPLLPDYQTEILQFLASRHADIALGFDSYEEVTV